MSAWALDQYNIKKQKIEIRDTINTKRLYHSQTITKDRGQSQKIGTTVSFTEKT